MNNHEYFYNCCIHDYCWNKTCFNSTNKLIFVRTLLFLSMLGLCVAEYLTGAHLRFLYFTNWGVYITTIVTSLQLACAIKYKKKLDNFNIKLKVIQDNLMTQINKDDDEQDAQSDDQLIQQSAMVSSPGNSILKKSESNLNSRSHRF